MSPHFVLGQENVPCVTEVVNRSLIADCTDFTIPVFSITKIIKYCQEHLLSYKILTMVKKIEQLIAKYNLDITTNKYRSKNENFHLPLSHKKTNNSKEEEMQTSFLEEWDAKILARVN